VAGEAAETLLIFDSGTELITGAKAPYQRHLAKGGGVEWVPAASGAVLSEPETEQLRALAMEVNDRYAPVLDESGRPRPWDIEFGFVAGELTLFQFRPLVERSSQNADAVLHRLSPGLASETPREMKVALHETASTGIAER
jgi:hypothetical protein